jgi:hypothetical protein
MKKLIKIFSCVIATVAFLAFAGCKDFFQPLPEEFFNQSGNCVYYKDKAERADKVSQYPFLCSNGMSSDFTVHKRTLENAVFKKSFFHFI